MINFLPPETMRIWGFNYGKARGGKEFPRWVKNLPAMQEMQETRVWSPGREDSLEKEMATHPSIIAWEISWTEEPGGLQSMGSQRVGHYWSDLACLRSFIMLTRRANSTSTRSYCSFYISLITDVDSVSCLLVMWLSSLVRCLLKSFTHFILNVVLLFSHSYLYIRDTRPLLTICITNTFSQSLAYLFIL